MMGLVYNKKLPLIGTIRMPILKERYETSLWLIYKFPALIYKLDYKCFSSIGLIGSGLDIPSLLSALTNDS